MRGAGRLEGESWSLGQPGKAEAHGARGRDPQMRESEDLQDTSRTKVQLNTGNTDRDGNIPSRLFFSGFLYKELSALRWAMKGK